MDKDSCGEFQMRRIAILLFFMLVAAGAVHADQHRSGKAIYQFKKQTGYLGGRPGHVIDHIVPLCAGGADSPENMQWQTIEEAKQKDRLERVQCRERKVNEPDV